MGGLSGRWLAPAISNGVGYSLLPAGMTCDEVGLGDVSDSSGCKSAMGAAGLGEQTFSDIPAALGFSCVYDSASGIVLYSLSTGPETLPDPKYRYMCPGIRTSTVSSSTTETVASPPGFSILAPGRTCADVGLADIPSRGQCFAAAPGLGVTTSTQIFVPGAATGISCAYDTRLDILFFVETTGDQTRGDEKYRFLCLGAHTTTGIPAVTATSVSTASVLP